jgi:hypothetical protein
MAETGTTQLLISFRGGRKIEGRRMGHFFRFKKRISAISFPAQQESFFAAQG